MEVTVQNSCELLVRSHLLSPDEVKALQRAANSSANSVAGQRARYRGIWAGREEQPRETRVLTSNAAQQVYAAHVGSRLPENAADTTKEQQDFLGWALNMNRAPFVSPEQFSSGS